MMPSRWIHITIAISLILITFSCREGSVETNYNPVLLVANNQVMAEQAYAHVFYIFLMVVQDTALKQSGTHEVFGAQCSYQSAPDIQYVIDFQSQYTLCPDNIWRRGSIIASLNHDFNETGAIAELSFKAYEEDSLRLEGINTIHNSGISAGVLQSYEHYVPDARLSIIDTTGEYPFQWTSEKYFIYQHGFGTPYDFSDDQFMINGTASGSDINGVAFTSSIEELLGNFFDCNWIRTGRTSLSTPGQDIESGMIEYLGQDTCSRVVRYTFNGIPFYESFPYR